MSFSINIIFLIETFLIIIANPYSLTKIWQILNVFFVFCSSISMYVNVVNPTDQKWHPFIESMLVSTQIFRFFLIVKHLKSVKKYLKLFKLIIIKSMPIISLFFIVIFFYGVIGKKIPLYQKTKNFLTRSQIIRLFENPKIREFRQHKLFEYFIFNVHVIPHRDNRTVVFNFG